MKFVRRRKDGAGGESFIFHISQPHVDLLLALLRAYPLVDVSHHRLSKDGGKDLAGSQELLSEAMQEQRKEQSKKIAQLLRHQGRYFREREGQDYLEFTATGEQMEWLLQTLNDVRVGSWIRLGCPELSEPRRAPLTEQSASHLAAIELSGYFQSVLLHAMDTA